MLFIPLLLSSQGIAKHISLSRNLEKFRKASFQLGKSRYGQENLPYKTAEKSPLGL